MKFRNTFVLIAILAALGIYVYLVEVPKAGHQPDSSTAAPMLDLTTTDVRRIEVQTSGDSVVLERDEGQPWWIKEPIEYAADEVKVNRILDRLSSLKAQRTLTGTLELADFGLVTPAVTVTLGLADGSSQRLFVGSLNPQGSSYYVQKAGEPDVHLVYASIVDDLKRLAAEPPKKPTPTPTATVTPTEVPTTVPTPTATPKP